jgi:hypothetical protein
MAARLAVAPEAELDIAEAYVWYEQRRIGLGEEFLTSVDAWQRSGASLRCTLSFTSAIGGH